MGDILATPRISNPKGVTNRDAGQSKKERRPKPTPLTTLGTDFADSQRLNEEAPARWIDRGFPTKGVIAGNNHRLNLLEDSADNEKPREWEAHGALNCGSNWGARTINDSIMQKGRSCGP